MRIKKLTYRNFLDTIKLADTPNLIEKVETIIEHFRPSCETAPVISPVTFLLDYSTKRYLHVGESCFNILGYTAQWFLESGLEEYISKWHPADFEVISSNVFPQNLSFIQSLCPQQYPDYIFSYNYRILNPRGSYITVLQRFSYIPETEAGNPAGMIGAAFDITHFKNDASVIHTIERAVTTDAGQVNELVIKNVYPVFGEQDKILLGKREREILQLMSAGQSSKQIANRINLSIYTINNHRKNMLAKTGCKSSAELINFAVKHGLV